MTGISDVRSEGDEPLRRWTRTWTMGDRCVCGDGEAEDDRSAVLRCPVHGPAPDITALPAEA